MTQHAQPARRLSPVANALALCVTVKYDIKYWGGDGAPDLTNLNNEVRSETDEYRRAAIAVLTLIS